MILFLFLFMLFFEENKTKMIIRIAKRKKKDYKIVLFDIKHKYNFILILGLFFFKKKISDFQLKNS